MNKRMVVRVFLLVLGVGLGWFAVQAVIHNPNRRSAFEEAQAQPEVASRLTFVESPICGGRIMVERHPNDDFKSFHVTTTLTTDDYADYEDLVVADDSPNIELVRDLCEVNGVGKVMLRPREIIIEKGPAFTWEEVQPGVVEAIGFHLPCPPAEK